jgi:hypothetical protein
MQHSVSDAEITLPVQEGINHAHPLSNYLSNLVEVTRSGELFIFCYPQKMSSFEPLDWFPENCYRSGLKEAPSGTREYNRAAFGNIYADSPFPQPPLNLVDVGRQVADEHPASFLARLRHVRSYPIGSFQINYQSCRENKLADRMMAVLDPSTVFV